MDCVGLIGWWKFDGNMLDSSGAGWHMRYVAVDQDSKDIFKSRSNGYAAALTGDDSYMVLPNRYLGNDMSFCVWVKHNSFKAYSRIFDFG